METDEIDKSKSTKLTAKCAGVEILADSNRLISVTASRDVEGKGNISKRKRNRSQIDEEETEENIDKSLEEKIQACAKKNNFTPLEMKKLLRSVVQNDHVLALVKIQEHESVLRKESAEISGGADDEAEDDNGVAESANITPKFTRSTARALNKKPLPIAVLNEIETEPEIAALISEELHSDEEDEEYRPREEEYGSDDDPNTTVSDIDSQPCTPKTPATQGESEDDLNLSQYTEDGLFKVPRRRNESTSQQEEIIAKRTRSKVCLQETPIETIESSFIPPDIPNDMLDFDAEIDDVEIDNAWKEFLTDFSKPLNAHTEEDDEADPEYVAADIEPIDSEELKNVNISKKELNDLVAELFDGLVQEGVILEDIPLGSPKKTADKSIQKKKSKSESKSELNSPVPAQDSPSKSHNQSHQLEENNYQILNTCGSTDQPDSHKNTSLNEPQAADADDSQLHITYLNQSQFAPNQVSTPNSKITPVLVTSQQPVGSEVVVADPSVPVQLLFASTITPAEAIGTGSSGNQPGVLTLIPVTIAYSSPTKNVITVVPISSVPNSLTSYRDAASIQGATQTYSDLSTLVSRNTQADPNRRNDILAMAMSQSQVCSTDGSTVETVSLAQVAKNVTNTTCANTSTSQSVSVTSNKQHNIESSSFRTPRSYRNSLRAAITQRKYEALREIHITNEPTFAPDQKGFTELQRKLLEQQMRMHVQFIAQSFLQVYSHPVLWKYADVQRNMLTELDKHYSEDPRSAFSIWNLKLAVKLIKDWEAELSLNTPENTALMEFIYSETERGERRGVVQRFPARIMKQMIQNPAFIYGHLLPQMPFRPIDSQICEMIPAAEHLVAHSLQYTYKELEAYERSVRPQNPKRISIAQLCRYIGTTNTYPKSVGSMQEFVGRKFKEEKYNPIKYFFEHKRAPPFKHVLYDIDLNNVRRLEERPSELSTIWQEFINRLKALEIEKTTNPYGYLKGLNAVRDYNDPNYDTSCLYPKNQNITIHVNCVYDTQQNTTSIATYNSSSDPPAHSEPIESADSPKKEQPLKHPEPPSYFTTIHEPLTASSLADSTAIYKYGRNYESESESRASSVDKPKPGLECPIEASVTVIPPALSLSGTSEGPSTSSPLVKGQKRVTDYFKVEKRPPEKPVKGPLNWRRHYRKIQLLKAQRQKRHFKNLLRRRIIRKRQTKRKIKNLLTAYRARLYGLRKQYKNEHLARVFVSVKSLELYSDLLVDLRMFTKKMSSTESCVSKKTAPSKTSSDEEVPKARKPYRVGESLRQMLLPESKEDANEKDAIFAMNFFDKVEETLCGAGQHERYELFQKTLKNFDCQKDRVADLYQKMEKLFLPDHAQLAEIFLTFLLPSEAIEIGKFFEHFMVTNMSTFINKLNIFFNKQPAQIKKIYGALSELADAEDVTMEQVKGKILPLLKGNKFLIDWFLQNFETEKPNQSISNVFETINLKQLESQQGEAEQHEVFQQKDFVEETTDANACQLKYINGGIYYGSRILLPAKLSFLATELLKREEQEDVASEHDDRLIEGSKPCVHGVREYAERKLKNHLDKCDEETKMEEEDDKDKDKYTLCDDSTFKAHAARLNPALYELPQPSASASLKLKYSEGDTSPKKQCLQKRRSPKKNLPKSPTATAKKTATVPESSKALGIAKKLKTMTHGSDTEASSNPKTKRKQSKMTKSPSGEPTESIASHAGSDGAVSDSDKSSSVYEPKRKQPKLSSSLDEPHQSGSSVQSICSPAETISSSPTPSIAVVEERGSVWTRDEDKIILEEVKSGYDSEAKLVVRIAAKLPRRTEAEIASRHLFLMEVLTQLQGKGS